MLAASFILVSTSLYCHQGGFYHVWPKQSLRTGFNTSGLSTVRHSLWVNQKPEKHTQPAFPHWLLFKSEETNNTQSEGDSGDFTIGSLKTKHRRTHRQPHTRTFKEKQHNTKAEVNQTNKHKRYIEGPKGVHCGPARLKTTAQWAEGAGQEKKEVGHE